MPRAPRYSLQPSLRSSLGRPLLSLVRVAWLAFSLIVFALFRPTGDRLIFGSVLLRLRSARGALLNMNQISLSQRSDGFIKV
jgi:hypothetical protein